jgi:putative transposase
MGGCGKRIKRGAFKYTKLNKVFNSDLVGAYNILITPSPNWDRGNGPETRLWIEPSERGNVILNLFALAGPPCTLERGGGQTILIIEF